jgi:predicted glycosyltransferase
LRTIRQFKPDLCIGIGSPYLVVVARLLGVPGIIFEDTESATRVNLIYRLFATRVITPDCFRDSFGKKHIRISGFKESAYLHRNHFRGDAGICKELGVAPGEKYALVRFVSHRVNHDKQADGLTVEMKKMLVEALLKQGRVFISSEKGIPVLYPELEVPVHAHRMHQVIAFATVVAGESSTMAAEAALLGIPSVFFDNHGRGYTHELEHEYHLVSNYTVSEENVKKGIAKAQEILSTPDYVKTHTLYHRLVAEKIDVTEFMVRFAEEFPADN